MFMDNLMNPEDKNPRDNLMHQTAALPPPHAG